MGEPSRTASHADRRPDGSPREPASSQRTTDGAACWAVIRILPSAAIRTNPETASVTTEWTERRDCRRSWLVNYQPRRRDILRRMHGASSAIATPRRFGDLRRAWHQMSNLGAADTR